MMEKISEVKNLAEQFNNGHQEYASFIESDPIRNFLHYPTVEDELGDIRGKRILDIGCGDGLFSRRLAKERGAHVVGYDISPNLIERAQKKESDAHLDIEYKVADPLTFQSPDLFDRAVAVMVLPYSPDIDYIKNFFASARNNLKERGTFVAVVFNPEFRDFNQVVANRFFRKAATAGQVNFDFLDPDTKETKFNANLAQFSKADYERGAREGGFLSVEWKKLTPSEEGVKKLGKEFWEKAGASQPYALIVAQK